MLKKSYLSSTANGLKPGKESFELGPTVNKTQTKGTLSRNPKTTTGTDTENILHNSVSQISKGKGDTGDFLGEKENGVLAQQTVGRNTWKRTTRISNSSMVMEKGLKVEVLKRKTAIPLGEINPNGVQDKRWKLTTEEVSRDKIKQIIGSAEVAQQPCQVQ